MELDGSLVTVPHRYEASYLSQSHSTCRFSGFNCMLTGVTACYLSLSYLPYSFFVFCTFTPASRTELFGKCIPWRRVHFPFHQPLAAEHSARFSLASLRALYLNFKNDFGDLLEVTDFSIATWLAFGAGLQLLSQSWLPSGLSYWLPLLYLVYRIARLSIDCRCFFTGTFTNVMFGRWSATLPEPEDPSAVTATSDGVVMFLLGARINQFVPLLTPRRRVQDQ